MRRRAVLRALALTPLAAGVAAAPAYATDYALPAEVLDAIDGLSFAVAGRLRAIALAVPSSRAFTSAALAVQQRHQSDRERLRRRLQLGASRTQQAPVDDTTLAGLRTAQQALVFAHAEGLPALGDASAVKLLAEHMVELARELTVIDLWIEAEAVRG